MLAVLAAVGSSLLMLHFLNRLRAVTAEATATPAGLAWSWLAVALAAVVLPWVLYPIAQAGPRSAALAPSAIWSALWPVLVGGVLVEALRRSRYRAPLVPAGDIVVAGEAAVRRVASWSRAIERADDWLRQWPVAMLSLVGFAILLAALLAARP